MDEQGLDNMKKKNTLASLLFQQNVLTLLLLTMVVIALWVGFSIYFSYSKTTIAPTDATLIAPLTPRLDSALFDQLSQRKTWSTQELDSFQTNVIVTVEATPEPIPQFFIGDSSASPSASSPPPTTP